jgi:hypothetical protein
VDDGAAAIGRYVRLPGCRAWGKSLGLATAGRHQANRYEASCWAALKAACEWWAAHPDADPLFTGFKDVFGLIQESNEDAKAISQAMEEASRPFGGMTGAIHHAVIGHVFAIREKGWDAYVQEMRKP